MSLGKKNHTSIFEFRTKNYQEWEIQMKAKKSKQTHLSFAGKWNIIL